MICLILVAKFFVIVMVVSVTINVNGLRDPAKRLSFCH